jgi:hypothetical protein
MSHTTANTVVRSRYDNYQTISRRNTTANRYTSRMYAGRREAYPSNQDIQNLCRRPNARNESLGHLSADDMMWSAALITDSKLVERKDYPATHKDEFLYDLIEYGVMDRMEGEPRNASEEKSMRYAAVCSSFVYDHVVNLEQKVGSLPWYLFVWSNKVIPLDGS